MNLQSDELVRLRAANPAPVEPTRSQSPVAVDTLERILVDPIDTTTDSRGRSRRGRIVGWWSSRGLMLVLAPVLIAGGAAFAATDPLGWWSANPSYAKYRSDSARHVRTPTAQTLVCTGSKGLHCAPASWTPGSRLPVVNGRRSSGQPYQFVSAVTAPSHGISRQSLLAYVARRRAAGKLSAASAVRFRAAIAAVPDDFFIEYNLSLHYSTFGSFGTNRKGLTQVPPSGVPSNIVCEPAGSGLSCQNLNGDEHAPVGAGIYAAVPTRKWHSVHLPRENWKLPPGITFTPAEYRLLVDMLKFATLTSTAGSTGPTTRT